MCQKCCQCCVSFDGISAADIVCGSLLWHTRVETNASVSTEWNVMQSWKADELFIWSRTGCYLCTYQLNERLRIQFSCGRRKKVRVQNKGHCVYPFWYFQSCMFPFQHKVLKQGCGALIYLFFEVRAQGQSCIPEPNQTKSGILPCSRCVICLCRK